MNEPDEQNLESDWHAYQPSWSAVLLISFGFAGVIGWFAYQKTGKIEAFEVAGVGAVLLCIFLRWIQPRYRHLMWGDSD